MERLSEGAIELNDSEVFNNCSYSCYMNLADSLNKLARYEDIGLTPDEIKYFLKDFGISLLMENRVLKKQHEEDEEIINKMAKRLKSFEENTFNSGWISVSERLPSDTQRVLVTLENDMVLEVFYINDKFKIGRASCRERV